MNRRKFLVGLGAVSVATTGVVGSGALSSTESRRDLTVTVRNDTEAYLGFIPYDKNFAYGMGRDHIEFKFDDEFRDELDDDDQGDGVGTDSVYEFTNLFGVENQGTKPIRIFGNYDDDVLDDVQLLEFAPNPSDDPLTTDSRSTEIEPGNRLKLSMLLDTADVPTGTHTTTMSIVAAAEDSHVFPTTSE